MHKQIAKVLPALQFDWVRVEINRMVFRGYLSRDYRLTPDTWMLGFTNMPNYVFKVEAVREIEIYNFDTAILKFEDDPLFGKLEPAEVK